jgi:hypothetical protein
VRVGLLGRKNGMRIFCTVAARSIDICTDSRRGDALIVRCLYIEKVRITAAMLASALKLPFSFYESRVGDQFIESSANY